MPIGQVGPNTGATEIPVFSQSVTLTDAQIKTLPTSVFEVLPAAGTGVAIVPIMMLSLLNASAGIYTNITAGNPTAGGKGFLLVYGNDDDDATEYVNPDLFGSALVRTFMQSIAQSQSGSVLVLGNSSSSAINNNVNLILRNADGDLTGGNAANTLKVTLLYALIAT